MARPINLWGNPDSPTFARDYLTTVTFMGHRVPWHKWAVIPLMAVQADIVAAGISYSFHDVQTYNNRVIAGTYIKSNHAWALAVDINPAQNAVNASHYDMPPEVIAIFRAHGFKWGGDYRDYMHFEWLGLPVKEEDMTPAEAQQLNELRTIIAPKQSYVGAITNALLIGDKAGAKKLNDEFWGKWPQGVSGVPKGWSGA